MAPKLYVTGHVSGLHWVFRQFINKLCSTTAGNLQVTHKGYGAGIPNGLAGLLVSIGNYAKAEIDRLLAPIPQKYEFDRMSGHMFSPKETRL